MRHFSFSTLAFLALTLCSVSPTLASDWVVKQQGEKRSDITTYVRDAENSAIKQFRGVVETQHSMFSAMSVINDISVCQEWIYNCQEARYHYAEDGEKFLWMMFDGVWPASDRDLVMKSSFIQEDVNGPVTVQSIGQPGGAPEQADYVRIPMLNNSFYIEPLTDGWTRITFTTQVDPGGLVPAWIANMVATDAPIRTLEGLQKMMNKEPFKNYSEENLPTKLIEKHNLRFSTLGF